MAKRSMIQRTATRAGEFPDRRPTRRRNARTLARPPHSCMEHQRRRPDFDVSEVGVFACKHCGVVTKSADVIPWPVSADSAPGPMLPCTNQPKEGSVATKTQLSGMRGVYLVAAELVGH